MVFGHNTNLKVGDTHYHVQTEDRGVMHATIETTVYNQGRLIHKRKLEYREWLPLDGAKEVALKQRLDEQHRAVLEDLKSGALKLPPVAAGKPAAQPAAAPAPLPVAASGPKLRLRIQNPKDWLKARHASLKVRVTDEMGNPIGKAKVVARMEGTADPVEVGGLTDGDGSTSLEFDMPKFTVEDPMLIVDATWGAVSGRLRLQLKARPPKVPAV
jgi:hypothetical protein